MHHVEPAEADDLPPPGRPQAPIAPCVGSTIEKCAVEPPAVELDQDAKARVAEVDPADPALAVTDIDLALGVRQAREPEQFPEDGFQLAGRRHMVVTP